MVEPDIIPLYPEKVPKHLDYPDIPLYKFLDDSSSEFPSNIALVLETRSFDKIAKITYAELGEMSDKFAAFLVHQGINPGDKIALFLPNMIEFVVAYYGILKAGGVVVSLNFQYPVKELTNQLNQSEARGIVCADMITVSASPYETCKIVRDSKETSLEFIVVASVKPYLSKLKGIMGSILGKISRFDHRDLYFNDILNQFEAENRPAITVRSEDTAVIIFTGGTTGTPKGAMLTHKNLVSNTIQCSVWMHPLPERGSIVGIGSLPFFHSYGASTSMNLGIYFGSKMVLMLDPRENKFTQILYLLEKYRVQLFNTVPTLFMALLNHPKINDYDLTSLLTSSSGAAPLPLAVLKEFEQISGANLAEGYGLTETSPVTHINPMASAPGQKQPLKKNGSVGIPLPDTDAIIVDVETGTKILGPEKEGEIAIHGPQVMKGYYNKERETSEVMRYFNGKRYFLTGDIGKYDIDYYFYITDRKKDLINVSGYKAYPREIEDVLISHPKISNAACIGVPHPSVGETVKIFVVLKPGEILTKSMILEYCRQSLVKYKQPYDESYIEIRSELPLSEIGKVLRRALKEEEIERK